MKPYYLLVSAIILLFFSGFTTQAQDNNRINIPKTEQTKDSIYYESLRDSAIMQFHRYSLDSARMLLEEYYLFDKADSVTMNILTEIFLKQLQNEKKGATNFNQVNTWINTYPFVSSNPKFRKIKIIESLKLGIAAFDKQNFVLAENHYEIIHKEWETYYNKSEILALPNFHTLIFNLALKRFYDKDYKRSAKLFKQGKEFYPGDPEMAHMYESANAKITK